VPEQAGSAFGAILAASGAEYLLRLWREERASRGADHSVKAIARRCVLGGFSLAIVSAVAFGLALLCGAPAQLAWGCYLVAIIGAVLGGCGAAVRSWLGP
jgi:hypothetical protein